MANEFYILHKNFLNNIGLNIPADSDISGLEEYKGALRDGYAVFVDMLHKKLSTAIPHRGMMENLYEFKELLDGVGISISLEIEDKAINVENKFAEHCLDNAANACKKTDHLKKLIDSPKNDSGREEFFNAANKYSEFYNFVSEVVFQFNQLNIHQKCVDRLIFRTANMSPESRGFYSSMCDVNSSIELERADKILHVIGPLYKNNKDEFFNLKKLLAQIPYYAPNEIPAEAREILKAQFIETELEKEIKKNEAIVADELKLAKKYSSYGATGAFFGSC